MLVSFSFENFLSFKNRVKLNFQASAIKEHKDNLHSVYHNNDYKYLKSLGLYGANSSGKSNVIKAFAFYRNFILNSSKESNVAQLIPVLPFLLSENTENTPSFFEAVFYINTKLYRYGFQANKSLVVSEWLFQIQSKKEEKVFIRAKQDFSFDRKLVQEFKTKLNTLAEFTSINSLYLSVLAQFNLDFAQEIVRWFGKTIVAHDTDHEDLIHLSANLLSDETYRKLMSDIVVNSGLHIYGIESRINELHNKTKFSKNFLNTLLEDDIKTYAVKTRHQKLNDEKKVIANTFFDLMENESLGTQKFFGLLGPILLALKENRLLFIDEIDARLHTILLENVIGLFNSIKYNPLGAQLVFTSHNTTLLKKKLRRDQMIFVEKNDEESSTFESLYILKPKVRNDATFDKDYLSGKYGAIPFIATQMNLFE